MADYLKQEIRSKDVILDIGTGIGIQAIIAATLRKDVKVIATDINPFAVKNAKKNAVINNVSDRIEFIHSDLFQPLNEKEHFSLIIFNFPYLPLPLPNQQKKKWISRSWAQGIGNNNITHRFLFDCQTYLTDKGRALMVVSTLSNFDFKEWGNLYSIEKLAERSFFFEKIFLVKITKDSKF